MKLLSKNTAASVALVGIMAASVECAKLALASVPNVEAVTLLVAVYGYVFGTLGVAAAFVFVMIEPLIWGFGTWIISYFIYWPLVALCFMLLGKKGVSKRFPLTLAALILTAFFGILTAAVDVGLFSGSYESFGARFFIYYIRGVWFYVSQLFSNLLAFYLIFPTLCGLLLRIKKKF